MELKKITREEFDDIYEKHLLWLKSEGKEGQRADFSNTDLRGFDLSYKNLRRALLIEVNLEEVNLEEVILFRANLEGANLVRARLVRARLVGAKLEGTDLRGANLSEADLEGTDLRDANLRGAKLFKSNLEGAIGLPEGLKSNKEEQTRTKYQAEINRLESERIRLLTNANTQEEELKKNKELLDKLQKELDAKSTRSENVRKNIDSIFDKLDTDVTGKIKKEQQQLKWMLGGYFTAAIIFLGTLAIVWGHFFIALDKCTVNCEIKMDITGIWANVSPSVFLVSLIVLCVYQAHKCQRQLLAVSELLYNHQLIRSNLGAIIEINGEDNVDKSIGKVSTMFETWANHLITTNQTITSINNEKIELDKKDATGQEQVLSLIKELIKKL